MTSRVLVVGANGMLGHDLMGVLGEQAGDRAVVGTTRRELDVTDPDAVARVVVGFDVVINATAYSAVDNAETHEADAFAVNATGATTLARAAHATGARFLHVSTDYVFDGTGTAPYPENTPRAPLNAYGRSKAAGEEGVLDATDGTALIVRTAWLYGRHGRNFGRTMLALAETHPTVTVVTDQVGQPTWTHDLAERLVALADAALADPGIVGAFHATNSGEASWFDFARALYTVRGLDPERVHPTDSAAFPRPAQRPAYSVLGHDRWRDVGVPPMRPWRDALAAANAAGVWDDV